jgi:hypothetical protein
LNVDYRAFLTNSLLAQRINEKIDQFVSGSWGHLITRALFLYCQTNGFTDAIGGSWSSNAENNRCWSATGRFIGEYEESTGIEV